MQILIIDDDQEKCSEIKKALEGIPNLDIDSAHNIFSGKEKLSMKYYDLLILDINLPYGDEEDCVEDAGYLLFKEIQSVKILKKPGTIIILTSYEELQERYIMEVSKGLFTIVKYSALEAKWKDLIRNKVNYIIKSVDDSVDLTSNGYNYDLAIITAVQVEYDQVYRRLKNPETIRVKGDPTFYTLGQFIEGDKRLNVIVSMQHQMGMTAASVLTTKVIHNFKPRYVSMVGIAAGKEGEGNLGDIIIPTEVWDYGSGKIAEETDEGEMKSSNFLFKPDPKYIDLEVELKEIVNKNFNNILTKIKDEWPGKKPDSTLKLVKGPMACGSVVVQNEEVIKNFIDPHNRKLKGLDMESYGVFYAVENSFRPKPKVLVCKSICDFADSNKNDDYQEYSAFTSASFLYYLALSELF